MKHIFQRQRIFQHMLKNDITTQEYRNQMFLGLMEEVVELLKETPHKKHKVNQTFNRDKFVEECVDVQLYLVNLLLSAQCSPEEFELKIIEKQKVNIERQENKY